MPHAVYWFTNDLRLSDNPALVHALNREPSLSFVYCLEPRLFRNGRFLCPSLGQLRYRFLVESLESIDEMLFDHDQYLNVYHLDWFQMAHYLHTQCDIDRIYCSENAGFDERKNILEIKRALPNLNIITLNTHTLYSRDQLPFDLDSLPDSFSKFRKMIESKTIEIREPAPTPKRYEKVVLKKNGWRSTIPPINSDAKSVFDGGEKIGFAHLENYFQQPFAQSYKATRNELDRTEASTKFSPWLALGCISPRQVMHALRMHESQQGANESTYWIFFELLWREYFQWYSHKYNQKLFAFEGIQNKKPLTSFYDERYQRWCQGNTEYPVVNACMKQLNATGYMSNRGRQLVVSCFVNELKLDWRYGAAYFEEHLIDYDVAANWGNWQYLAGVGADPRGLRHFNLEKQTQTYDPEKTFINKWQGNETCLSNDSIDAVGWPIEPPKKEPT